ncbi:hypothetical protein CABS01_00323 [Colletotrichum abscissum]|uniref:Uncharacterized protein n=1 Tax=Colletotrichum abscissum TaxID=1671311 RepID=A0A9P9X994_9PEZI|nr:uncharacterized protein CABS01_00323 [Colletotrichum abscissum]KAI3544198.1 hypothetical protein CABS02_09872 [Colletotrichum abscissum]KAK1525234.1 hypothetical protein CABS01_00323 [Colletotrichum abscissum]
MRKAGRLRAIAEMRGLASRRSRRLRNAEPTAAAPGNATDGERFTTRANVPACHCRQERALKPCDSARHQIDPGLGHGCRW